ncbi:hypothetical protein SDC9_158811 [bioreactor metagenome]|uniref:Uncharacterized protein n=1 Tax=bioreactor metagenome TaxID=1076179 RepID=A0A645FAW3_9ZZZZ
MFPFHRLWSASLVPHKYQHFPQDNGIAQKVHILPHRLYQPGNRHRPGRRRRLKPIAPLQPVSIAVLSFPHILVWVAQSLHFPYRVGRKIRLNSQQCGIVVIPKANYLPRKLIFSKLSAQHRDLSAGRIVQYLGYKPVAAIPRGVRPYHIRHPGPWLFIDSRTATGALLKSGHPKTVAIPQKGKFTGTQWPRQPRQPVY